MPNFEQKAINYAEQYAQELANAYPYLSYFAEVYASPNNAKYKPVNAQTVMIPSMSVSGARAVNRNSISGQFSRNFNTNYEPKQMQMYREWDTIVDKMDIVETNNVATIANATKTFNEFQKIPEMDAYAASKIASFADEFGGVDATTLTAANILEKWDDYLVFMTDQRVNRDRVVCHVIPQIYKLLKEAAGLTRFIEATGGIQNVDRKMPLEDIASAKGLEMEERMDEIEGIVLSGTKLNLDYYIEQTLDDDIVDEIYDYFKEEAQSDSLADAMNDLKDDYDEMEVRLVRIKFLCEVAN